MGRTGLVLAAAVLLTTRPVPAAEPSKVRIEKHRATWVARVFDPLAPPEDLPPVEPGRDAVTVCDYWCKPILTYRTLATAIDAGGEEGAERCEATVEVLAARVIVELKMQSWLPEKASKGLKIHEAAHRDICEQVYDQGEALTRAAALRVLAAPVTGSAGECSQAIEDAVAHQATNEICGLYTTSRSEAARRVIEIYDGFVRAAKNDRLSVRRAIDFAFEQHRQDVAVAAAASASSP